ncbi:MAG: hypothetical protein JW741_16995 [Sedimentisphaerales bacterium]|nr:hypothetical protein [Sedimentisphaerales bacterium]
MNVAKTLVILLSFLFPGLVVPAAAELTREQLYGLLNEANTAFQQANAAGDSTRANELYAQAILLYQKIIEQGQIHNARLYYNLANAYFLKEDIGRAILNYRRAAKLDGGDINVQKNLAFARSQRIDKVAVQTEKRVLETLFFWHYDTALQTRFFLACLFFAALCVTLTVMIWLGRGPATSAVAVVAVILLVCFLTSVIIDSHRRVHTAYGVITAPEIVARQGDGPNYPPSFKDPLHAGTEFELVEQRPGWLHIKLADGTDAWIPDDSAGLV